MAVTQQLSVSLDESSQQVLSWLKQNANFKNNSIIVQEALHALHRELKQQQETSSSQFISSANLNPDDFE